jgi:hypothetical protein
MLPRFSPMRQLGAIAMPKASPKLTHGALCVALTRRLWDVERHMNEKRASRKLAHYRKL